LEKNLDHKGRWRNVTVAFRMSQEESDDLNRRVKLSGLNKQDYIIRRLTEREVVVQGNPRVHRALRNELVAILTELKRMEQCGDANEEFLSLFRLVMETVNGMKEDAQ